MGTPEDGQEIKEGFLEEVLLRCDLRRVGMEQRSWVQGWGKEGCCRRAKAWTGGREGRKVKRLRVAGA